MVKRLLDILLSSVALVALSPLFVAAALGIWITNGRPILFPARRMGLHGRVFTMYKFRTMQVNQGSASSPIAARNDPRVFPFGWWLRRLKIDELPQLLNILLGQMAVVGPRPEDPEIVRKYYTPAQWETLRVSPGLASPGSIYDYTHGERQLAGSDLVAYYGDRLLQVKLALDTVYMREASLVYDLRIIFRTAWAIFCVALGKHEFSPPPEFKKAMELGLIPSPENLPARDGPAITRPAAQAREEHGLR